jgi:hypothetical protein
MAGLLLTVAACAHGHNTNVVPPDVNPVRLEVTNNYALPIEVYADGSGSTHRLGMVHPGMVGHFTLPPGLLGGTGAVEFRAQPSVRGPQFKSGDILLSAGAIVDFMITPQLFNSTVSIRP